MLLFLRVECVQMGVLRRFLCKIFKKRFSVSYKTESARVKCLLYSPVCGIFCPIFWAKSERKGKLRRFVLPGKANPQVI